MYNRLIDWALKDKRRNGQRLFLGLFMTGFLTLKVCWDVCVYMESLEEPNSFVTDI